MFRCLLVLLLSLLLVACQSRSDEAEGDADKRIEMDQALAFPIEWKLYENDDFSFRGPTDLIKMRAIGTDSFIGKYQGGDYLLTFDYGWHSDDSFEGRLLKKDFVTEHLTVDGREAQMGYWEDNKYPPEYPLACAIFVPNIKFDKQGNTPVKLTMKISFTEQANEDRARLILRSITFK